MRFDNRYCLLLYLQRETIVRVYLDSGMVARLFDGKCDCLIDGNRVSPYDADSDWELLWREIALSQNSFRMN
jgi:hypothetical protein